MITKDYESSKILIKSLLVKLTEKFKFNLQQFYNGNQKSTADQRKVKIKN